MFSAAETAQAMDASTVTTQAPAVAAGRSRSARPTLSVEVVTDASVLDDGAGEWAALLERSATNEPTLSPLWLRAWWQVFGALDGRQLRVCLIREGERLVGLAPLLYRHHRHMRFIPFRRLELLASGEDQADEICSDYVGVIAERGLESAVARSLTRALVDGALGRWDELVLRCMNGETALPADLSGALAGAGLSTHTSGTGVARAIRLPARWEDYLAMLSSEKRYFVRRSIRDFERWSHGKARFELAATPSQLAEGKKILIHLHNLRWRSCGRPSLFDSRAFRAFHDEALARLLERGALDLHWLTVGDRPVAALYNIRWANKVYYYQSGRIPDAPKGIRPGLVLHAHAVRQAIEASCREYDFLAGDSRLKRQLATQARPLVALRAAPHSAVELARRMAAGGRAWLRERLQRVRELDKFSKRQAEDLRE